MIWRYGKSWFMILLVSLALLSLTPLSSRKAKAPITSPRMYEKSEKDFLPPLAAVPVPPRDWADVGLKVSAGLGGLMTLTNLIEKFIKMLRRKPD